MSILLTSDHRFRDLIPRLNVFPPAAHLPARHPDRGFAIGLPDSPANQIGACTSASETFASFCRPSSLIARLPATAPGQLGAGASLQTLCTPLMTSRELAGRLGGAPALQERARALSAFAAPFKQQRPHRQHGQTTQCRAGGEPGCPGARRPCMRRRCRQRATCLLVFSACPALHIADNLCCRRPA